MDAVEKKSLPSTEIRTSQSRQTGFKLHYFPDIPIDDHDNGHRCLPVENKFKRTQNIDIDASCTNFASGPAGNETAYKKKSLSVVEQIEQAYQSGFADGKKQGMFDGEKKGVELGEAEQGLLGKRVFVLEVFGAKIHQGLSLLFDVQGKPVGAADDGPGRVEHTGMVDEQGAFFTAVWIVQGIDLFFHTCPVFSGQGLKGPGQGQGLHREEGQEPAAAVTPLLADHLVSDGLDNPGGMGIHPV